MLTKLGKYSFLYHIKSFIIYILSVLPLPKASLVLVVGQMRTGSTNIQDSIAKSLGAFNAHQWVFDKPRNWPLKYLNGYLKLIRLRGHRECVIKLLAWNTVLSKNDNKYANNIDIKSVVDYGIRENGKIVFLKREDLFNLSLSEAYAWETKSWLKDSGNHDEGLSLNLSEFQSIVFRKNNNSKYLDNLIKDNYQESQNVLTLLYEDLFERDIAGAQDRLSTFIGADFIASKQVRILGKNHHQIKNLEDLRKWFFSQKL